MFKDKLNYKLLNILIFSAILYLALITMDYWWNFTSKVISILFPFVLAFAIAYALYPAVRKLQEKGVRKNLAVAIIVVVISVLLISISWVTIHLFYDQLLILSGMLGDVITDISNKFSLNLGEFRSSIDSIMNNVIKYASQYVSNGTINFVNKTIDLISKFIIVAIVSIYFLIDMDNIRSHIKSFLKRRKRNQYQLVKAIDKELGQYLSGLAMFMIIQFFEYALLFWIVGHPNWLLLGILASITTIIPYFGGLITNIIAVVLASVVSFPLFISTLIICLVAPNIDGYIISPKIYGKSNNISPLWTIFAVFAGGALYGFVGIVIALPLYIILNCIFNFYKEDIHQKINKKKE